MCFWKENSAHVFCCVNLKCVLLSNYTCCQQQQQAEGYSVLQTYVNL